MVPPDVYGEVVAVYHGSRGSGAGTDGFAELTIHEPVLRVKQSESGELIDVSMSHKWPVRKPRPVAEKLPGKEALITGAWSVAVLCGAGCELRRTCVSWPGEAGG